jgi:hypothetical protein
MIKTEKNRGRKNFKLRLLLKKNKEKWTGLKYILHTTAQNTSGPKTARN